MAILDLLIVLSWCGILLMAEVLFMLKACHRIGNNPSGLRFLNYYRVVLMVSRRRWRLKVCWTLVDVNGWISTARSLPRTQWIVDINVWI